MIFSNKCFVLINLIFLLIFNYLSLLITFIYINLNFIKLLITQPFGCKYEGSSTFFIFGSETKVAFKFGAFISFYIKKWAGLVALAASGTLSDLTFPANPETASWV